MKKKLYCSIGLFMVAWIVVPIHLYAQNAAYPFDHLSLEQGLPQSTPMCFLQDRQGFMWVGTQEGLCRYDGYTFQVYKHDANDSTSLSSNVVRTIYQDKDGAIWLGTFGGLSCFNPAIGKFRSYLHHPKQRRSISHNRVEAIAEDQKGNLWIGTQDGLNRFDRRTRTFTRLAPSPADSNSLHDNQIMSLATDADGLLWIGTYGSGLYTYDIEKRIFTRFVNNPSDAGSLASNVVRCLFRDASQRLWVGTDGGLCLWDRAHRRFVRYTNDPANPNSISFNVVMSMGQDRTGLLWVGTKGGGLNVFDPKTGRFIRLQHDPANPRSLGNDIVWSVYEDRGGVAWIGSDGGGINTFDRKKNQFAHFTHNPANPASLSHPVVWSFCEDRSGTLWVGTQEGLNAYDRKTRTFTHYKNKPGDANSLSYDNVSVIKEDYQGYLWIGTDGGGLNRFDPRTKQFLRISRDASNPQRLSSNGINQIWEDHRHTLWIGTSDHGLERYDRATGTFAHFAHDPNNPNSLSDNHVMALLEDQSGTLWIGTLGKGLNAYDPKTGHFTRFSHDPHNPQSLNEDRVIALAEGSDGALWVGTAGSGLNRLDRKTGRFTHYTEKKGLPNNVVYGILPDKKGHLWISTNRGICQFSPFTGTFRVFDVQDGLQNNEFNNWAYYQSKRGELFFGGINGFNAFFPEKIQDNPTVPPIQFTDFKLRNQRVNPEAGSLLPQPITETRDIILPYFENMLSLDFAALDFTAPDKHHYAYQLEGLDQDWIQAGTQHSATYTNLSPGEYIFRVKGTNNNGLWNEQGAMLRIVITPPFWKTWWAYTLYGLSVIGIAYAIARFQLNKIALKNQVRVEQLQAEKFQEIERIKSHFFTNISHEFRTPLTLILGPMNKLLADNVEDRIRQPLEMMHRNAQRLLLLINQLLDLSKLETGHMSLSGSRADLVTFVEPLVQSFQSLANGKGMTLRLVAEEKSLPVDFDGDKVEKIVYNLLSNALKFTSKGGQITLTVGKVMHNGMVCAEIKVRDTGLGIPAEKLPRIFDRYYQVDNSQTRAQPGTGIGLALVKDLVELHGGQIRVSSVVGEGTEFVVWLPVENERMLVEMSAPEKTMPHEAWLATEIPITDTALPTIDPKVPLQATRPIVLVVEDNTDMRAYIRGYLTDTYEVLEAQNGREGIEKALDTVPDLIISDVMMPEVGGYELSKTLKQDSRTSHIPIILLTAKSSRESRLEGLETGADDYLHKPFDPDELLLRVRNAIRTRRRLLEQLHKPVLRKPEEVATLSMEEEFLQRIIGIIEARMADESFSVEELGKEAGMSRTQIHRKLTALTNQSASELIRTIRLQRALEMLRHNTATISEIAYAVGFSSPNYFARSFHQHFGYSPSDFKKQTEGAA